MATCLSIAIPLAGLGACFAKPQLNGAVLITSSLLPIAALILLCKLRGLRFAIGLGAVLPAVLWATYISFIGLNLMDDGPSTVFARARMGDSEVVVEPDWDYDGVGEAVVHQRPLLLGLITYRKLDTLPDGSRPSIVFSGPSRVTVSFTADGGSTVVRSYWLEPHVHF